MTNILKTAPLCILTLLPAAFASAGTLSAPASVAAQAPAEFLGAPRPCLCQGSYAGSAT